MKVKFGMTTRMFVVTMPKDVVATNEAVKIGLEVVLVAMILGDRLSAGNKRKIMKHNRYFNSLI